MTEAQWHSCSEPGPMLEVVLGFASDRKLRLFGVGCLRRIWDSLDDLGRAAVEASEEYADGLTSVDALRMIRLACRSARSSSAWYAAATRATVAARNSMLSAQSGSDPKTERATQAELLRDLFGNPFPPVPINCEKWMTPTVVTLARAIYDERDFCRLPTLADALGAAGCDTTDILEHCQSNGLHTRGCWVVDLILGKE